MKYSGHRKILCEFSKLSKFNAFNPFKYYTNNMMNLLLFKNPAQRELVCAESVRNCN